MYADNLSGVCLLDREEEAATEREKIVHILSVQICTEYTKKKKNHVQPDHRG